MNRLQTTMSVFVALSCFACHRDADHAATTPQGGNRSAAPTVAAEQKRAKIREKYRGQRVLVWAIDKASRTVQGFDDEMIASEQQVALEPVEGYSIQFKVEPLKTVTVSDFQSEWEEDRIPFKISHGTGSVEGMLDPTSPFLHIEYGFKEHLASVVFAIPVGTIDSALLLERLGQNDTGTAAGLEDLLLIAAVDPKYSVYVSLDKVLETYQLLRESQRTDDWMRRLNTGMPNERVVAAAVLMSLGNEQGTRAFCTACLQAKGNEQIELVENLARMSPSGTALATIVKLIVSPQEYRFQTPGGGDVADMDRRGGLIGSLTTQYSRDEIGPYAESLKSWAKSKTGEKNGGQRLLRFLDAE